jgi:hypothetical protein
VARETHNLETRRFNSVTATTIYEIQIKNPDRVPDPRDVHRRRRVRCLHDFRVGEVTGSGVGEMTRGTDDAFPTLTTGEDVRGDTGLTKREYFAAVVLQGIASKAGSMATLTGNANLAVQQADLLIAALNAERT